MASGAKLRGLVELQRKIKDIARRFPIQVADALYDEMGIEMKESMKRTPVETGDLRDSHELVGPIIRQNKIRVEIRVGKGLKTAYAVPVHEDLEAIHPVGQAKFLESTLLESAPYILRRVATRVKLGQE